MQNKDKERLEVGVLARKLLDLIGHKLIEIRYSYGIEKKERKIKGSCGKNVDWIPTTKRIGVSLSQGFFLRGAG